MGRAERASPAELAGISYRAWVWGICIALAIGFIFGMVIAGAHAGEIEARACRPQAPCIEAGGLVRVPLEIVETGNRKFGGALELIETQRREIERLRAKQGCV